MMATVNYHSMIDAVWEQWSKGLNHVYESNKQLESWTKQALEQQKELFATTFEQLQEVDDKWKEDAKEVQVKTVESIRKTAGDVAANSYEEWSNRAHEALQKLQDVTLSQSKTNYALVQQAQKQYEQVVSQLLSEQHKTRDEFQQLTDKYMEQLKSFQKSFLDSLEPYSLVK
ncbi:polyhydroxyalkanoic acid inclusion protein PhaP [Priestia koreensis]|uniref:polyhydroxyalkanoic acid inclusion protein PhaP n=1 Tax=Priestia koreensis TaxID=284581 RepID=UPI0034575C6E